MNPIPGRTFYLHCNASKGSLDAFGKDRKSTINKLTAWKKGNKRFVFRVLGSNVENVANSANRLVSLSNDKARSRKVNPTN